MTSDAVEEKSGDQFKARVFISYSRKDVAFADRLEVALKARGFEPLIDRTEIYAFEEWWKRIEALIARADTVVFVLSPDAVTSDVALREVSFAASLNKRLAPIVWRRVDDRAVPEALAKLNFIFFDDEARFEESADQLTQAFSSDAAAREQPAGATSSPAVSLPASKILRTVSAGIPRTFRSPRDMSITRLSAVFCATLKLHRLDKAAHRVRRGCAALGSGERPDRTALALAGAGGGGALDRGAAAGGA
jgi:TIR domain